MDKRTILAIVLSAAILILYYGFFYQAPAPAPQGTDAKSPTVSQNQGETPPTEAPAPATPQEDPETRPPIEIKKEVPIVVSEITSPLVEAKFSSKGGFPLRWVLKTFFQEADKKGGNIDLLHGTEKMPAMGLLLYPGKPAYYPRYQVEQEGSQKLRYRSKFGSLALEQDLEMGEEKYSVLVKLKVQNQSQSPQSLTPGIRVTVPEPPGASEGGGFLSGGPNIKQLSPLYRLGTSVEREQDVKKLGIYQEQTGDISWAGLEDRYFLRAILARSVSQQNVAAYGKKGPLVYADLRYPMDTLAPGDQKVYQFTLYLGPKDPTYLNQFAGVDLGKAIDYGWFGFVARPILQAMKFFYSFLRNWGLAIIFLTIVIKVLLYPLTRKSMASMKSMQALQPQLKAIREKYKEDKERLNMETMNLFKRHKVNPMGGCLPMLIQMPIYIALYKVLYNATELYHAPFFWFYRDLSAPDPYYILPILLGISMVAQQKMTPSAGDPMQKKMMMIMPVMFTVFMLFLPVGLVLYIFVNTIMTVVQQYMHQHDISILGLLKGQKKARA